MKGSRPESLPERSEAELVQRQRQGRLRACTAAAFRRLVGEQGLAAAYAELGRGAEAAEAAREARLKNPWFDVSNFGSRFQDRDLQRRIQTSLRKAGFE